MMRNKISLLFLLLFSIVIITCIISSQCFAGSNTHLLKYSHGNEMIDVIEPDSTKGMKRFFLRSNIKRIGGEDINLLTQEMFYNSETEDTNNTCYYIQHDFTLAEDINLPPNSIIEFDGGSLKGQHKLKGNLTCIRGNAKFSHDISFDGTFNNIPTVYVDWFVNDYKANRNCSSGIKKAILLAKLARTSLTFGGSVNNNAEKYFCTSGGFDISGLVVNGNGSWLVGVGDYNMFIVDGDCHIRDLHINKYPFQDGSTDKDYNNYAIACRNNHHMKFDNVIIDGFHYGFIFDEAWNIVINGCSTNRCMVGIHSKGLSVNNNISNSRILASNYGIEAIGASEGWMVSDNLIVASTGISLKNHANTIIKGNIIDHCKKNAMQIIQNCPGLLIDNNYMAINKGGSAIIDIKSQIIKNDEDQMISITNNILRGYKTITGMSGVYVSKGKYKHLKICGNHIKAEDLQYGVMVNSDAAIDVLNIKDNVVEGNVAYPPIDILGTVNNSFVNDNVKLKLNQRN